MRDAEIAASADTDPTRQRFLASLMVISNPLPFGMRAATGRERPFLKVLAGAHVDRSNSSGNDGGCPRPLFTWPVANCDTKDKWSASQRLKGSGMQWSEAEAVAALFAHRLNGT
jgi:hypothetical protein